MSEPTPVPDALSRGHRLLRAARDGVALTCRRLLARVLDEDAAFAAAEREEEDARERARQETLLATLTHEQPAIDDLPSDDDESSESDGSDDSEGDGKGRLGFAVKGLRPNRQASTYQAISAPARSA